MATYPVHGSFNWDPPLQAYIDETAIQAAEDATAGSSTDAGVAFHIDNGPLTQQALADEISRVGGPSELALSATYEAGDLKRIYVSGDGDDANSGLIASKPKLTLAAALTAMGVGVEGVIVAGYGDIDAGSGVDWTGYKCGLVGVSPLATRIVATAQTGPVLDLSGVGYDLNNTEFGNFSIIGDGTAGSTKKGLVLDASTSVILVNFHDITVRDTGGAPFDLGMAELCVFSRLLAYEPVSASSNDIPYFTGRGACNGNTFRDCQINGVNSTANVGVSGAFILTDDGTYAPRLNKLDAFKINNLHLPTNATVFAIAGNGNKIADLQEFDTGKVVGDTGTSYIRFTVPSVTNFGANEVTGVIPGNQGATNSMDTGVDIRQSRNTVRGIKGYKGFNVILANGVQNSYIELTGAYSTATDAAVTDNSAQTSNFIADRYLQTVIPPVTTFKQSTASYNLDQKTGAAFAGMPRFSDPGTPANGGVMIGTSDTRVQAAGTTMLPTADQFTFRDIAVANMLAVTKNGGVKGLKFYTSASLPTAGSAYRGQVGWVEGGAGVADRFVICRKDAADAYAWVDLF